MNVDVKQRYTYFDSLKFVLIVCVVLGHFLGIDKNNAVNVVIYNFLYSFHMPLFVFISGFFSKESYKSKSWKDVLLLLEMLLFSNLYYCIFFQDCPKNIKELLTPWYATWYLLTLAYYRLFINYVPLPNNKKFTILGIAIVLSVLVCFTPADRMLSVSRTIAFFPFFLLGYHFKESVKIIIKYIKSLNKLFYIFFIVVILIGFYYSGINFSGFFMCADPDGLRYGLLGGGIRFLFIPFAVVVSICVMALTPDKPLLATLGKKTLYIFIFHGYLVLLIEYLSNSYEISFNTIELICLTCFSILLILFVSSFNLSNIIFNPISCIVNHFIKK